MSPQQTMRLYAGAGAALLLVLAVEWLPAGQPPPVPPAQALRVAHAAMGLAPKQTAAWSTTILRRPLFNMNRQPPKSAEGPRAVADNGQGRLVGVIITRNRRSAIFAGDGGKPRVLSVGDTIGENTIRAIGPDGVTMHPQTGRDFAVQVTFGKSTAAPGAPVYTPPAFAPGFPAFNPMPPVVQQPQPPTDGESGEQPPPTPTPGLPMPFPGFRGPVPPRRD